MSEGVINTAYIISAVMFIFSLAGFSKHEKSQQGNNIGIIGMIIALIATISRLEIIYMVWTCIAMTIGGITGIYLTKYLETSRIPELIAILHSLVGLAAVFIGFNSYHLLNDRMVDIHLIEIFLGVFIGAFTFTGSVVAFGKLSGKISPKQLLLPNGSRFNLLALILTFLLLIAFIHIRNAGLKTLSLIAMTIISLMLGWHVVASIGGSDMPVIISMLNSYSGWAASAAGFMLNNNLLIIIGALVGSSGSILSYLMCKAMNRSFISIITGSSLIDSSKYNKDEHREISGYNEITAEETAVILKNSNSVIITPGYGMAAAQAQYPIAKMVEVLRTLNIKVRFGIHPVAGRLPGHMNVLLAEVKIPYDIMLDIDEINNDFINTDTVLVIGANDTVNPASLTDSNSPIAGMPVLTVWKAQHVIVFKRSMNFGYTGMLNPLFFKENTYMLFGDAKASINAILKAL